MAEFHGLLDPPPDSNDPELDLARHAKAMGLSKRSYLLLRSDAIRLTGRTLQWNSATYDLAFVALRLIAEEVWGVRQ